MAEEEILFPSERAAREQAAKPDPAKLAEAEIMFPSEVAAAAEAKEAARPSVNPLVEGGRSFMESWEGVKHGLGPAETPTEGPWSSFKRTGSGLLSAAALPFAFPMGVAKSALANVTAPALRAAEYGIKKGVQQVKPDFDPKVQTHQEAYEALLPGSEAALSGFGPAVGPRGAILPIAPVRKTPSGGLITKGGQEVTAGKMLEKAATDPEAAIGALDAAKEIVPGSRPTTFQATGDLGLGQLERVVQNTPEGQAAFQQRWAEQNNARVDALRTLQQPHVDPLTVSSTLRTAMQADDALGELELVAARARAEQRAAALGNDVPPEISGQVMRQELDQAHGRIRGEERAAWENVDPNNNFLVNAGPVSNAQFRLYGEMSEAAAAGMTDAERTISGIISRSPQTIPFRDMRDLRSLVSTEMRKELFTSGQSPTYARLTQLRGAIQESVNNPVSAQTGMLAPDAAIRLQQATDLTRRRADLFKQGPVEDVLKREGAAGPFNVTNAAVPNRFIPVGPKGYDHVVAYLRAVGNERGMPDIYDALISDLRSKAMNREGSIDPQALFRWAKGKEHAIRAVSERDGGELVRRLQNVEAAEQSILDIAAQRKQREKSLQEGIFGKLIGADNPTDIQNILGGIFNKQTAVGDAEKIMARLRAAPEAQMGARQAVVDWIWDKFLSNTAAGTTDENIIRADQFQQFIKLKQPVLEAFGFTPEQISTWLKISDDMRQTKMSIDATKMRGGPGTAQDLNAMYQMREDLGQNLFRRIAYRLMAGSLGWAAEGPLGGAAAMFGAGVVSSMRDRGIRSVQDLVKNAMMNPVAARGLLSRVRGREVNPWSRTWLGYEATAQQQGQPQQPPQQGYKYGGAIRPPSRKGIQARNKARAVAARERSSLARQSAQAKRKVKYADGGLTRGSEGGIGDAAAAFSDHPTINAMERMHQARKLAQGEYDTRLRPDQETGFRQWKAQNAPRDSGQDYDLRGAYRAGVTPDQSGHMPDTYKKPNHPTFSNQSQYAIGADQARAGSWEGETYVPPRLAEGGGVDVDSSDPLQDELKRRNTPGGLGATAGPTVTSTTPVQDIPAPKVNAAGETLPTYVLKEMGKGLLGAPEQFTHAAGDLQRRGEYAGSQEDMPYGGPPPEEMPAGAAAALMLYGANAPFPKPGIGVFGGRGAVTANKGMLAEAEKMLAAGVPHATIRNRTGWEFGSEGKPKFEISDAESYIKPEAHDERIFRDDAASRDTGFRPNKRLEEVFHHPALYEAYPWLRDMRTSIEVGEGVKPAASFAPPTKSQKRFGKAGELEVRAPTYERGGMGDLFEKQYASDVGARDMLLHEIQHAIQEREKFAPGSNPRQLPLRPAEVETIAKNMAVRSGVDWSAASLQEKQNMIRVVRHRIYKAQAGEAEARNVQTRADSTLPSRASWETEDIKRQNQMIDKNRKLKPGEKPFSDAKIYKLERDPETEVVPGSKEWRDAPNPNAPFPQYAENYPPVGPPVATTFKNVNKKTGEVTYKEGFSKEQTPQAKAFMKERARIIKDMDENGYHPYFDEEKRFDVNPKNYPLNTDTIQIVPKTLNKLAEHFYKVGAIETRRALQAAYKKGVELGQPDVPGRRLTTQDWYMMGQLEQDLVRQMGPKAGREAFKEKFATSMAATTGGMKPRDNLIAAGYQNYLAAKGERWPEETHQWPTPVASQYGSQLSNTAQRIQDEGGFKALGEQNPKRHNFAGDFMGHRKLGTMDEQMTDLMQPGKGQPDWYGINEHIMAQEAEKAGADPRMFQETAWAGHKGAAGGPMIREVNHTIERIHRLTGMPRSEIVLRAWGRGDIPVYGAAGLAALKALEGEFTGEE